ncbi:STAS/SEC14 domain-containing protein [Haloarcula nitratireducens]|uniref:STAS/SEC14 domain-containing protein n=1 Tax=Haloarcula nitratireducens TaxID=2487749 RepID=A0AAW4PJ32_9EURY|nr:STAS/SEC14 domain-containing protein [Halomicroarcula nitratireducens]MBX0297968.1 STAS/SEC14 domain-containing protein [Halomicroarcula nitratireducens]
MYEVLDETDKNLVAIRVHQGTRNGYEELYSLLAAKTEQHGRIHVYEEVPGWTFSIFLTHLHGLIPDLQYGSHFNIGRYAAVGDSTWAKLLFDWWRAIRPIWPVAPDKMRYFEIKERERALDWLREAL